MKRVSVDILGEAWEIIEKELKGEIEEENQK